MKSEELRSGEVGEETDLERGGVGRGGKVKEKGHVASRGDEENRGRGRDSRVWWGGRREKFDHSGQSGVN